MVFDIVDNPEVRSLKVANSNMSKSELLDYIDELETMLYESPASNFCCKYACRSRCELRGR